MKGMGFAPPRAPKAEASTPEGLHALWTRAGFADIEARVLRTRRTFDDFEDYWSTTITAPNLAPMLTTIATADVTQLKSRVREQVPIEASGRVSIEAPPMRSLAVGPDRAVDRSSALPPEAGNLYACHEVMGATAWGPSRTSSIVRFLAAIGGIANIRNLSVHGLNHPTRKPSTTSNSGQFLCRTRRTRDMRLWNFQNYAPKLGQVRSAGRACPKLEQ